jgi:cell division protein FtsN
MQKDFKTAKPTDSGYKTGMLWMLAGVFMGLLVGLSMYFYANRHAPIFATANAAMTNPEDMSREEKIAQANAQTPDAVVSNQTEQSFTPLPEVLEEPEPRKRAVFSFHAVLPTIDMPVTPRPVAITAAVAEVAQNTPTKSGDIFLQVASFKSMAQASRSQVKLNGRGVTSRVEKHSSKGKTWYRVLAGPIAQMQLPDWKKQVKSLGYDPLVRKVR